MGRHLLTKLFYRILRNSQEYSRSFLPTLFIFYFDPNGSDVLSCVYQQCAPGVCGHAQRAVSYRTNTSCVSTCRVQLLSKWLLQLHIYTPLHFSWQFSRPLEVFTSDSNSKNQFLRRLQTAMHPNLLICVGVMFSKRPHLPCSSQLFLLVSFSSSVICTLCLCSLSFP